METVLVTGANRGLGLEIVWHLVQEEDGPLILATCRHPEKAETLARMKSEHPERLKVFSLDITDPESVEQTREAIGSQVGHLDWLVNNAGVGGFQTLDETRLEDLMDVYQVNVAGPLLVTRAFRDLLKAAEHPMVFLMSSRMGSLGYVSEAAIDSYPYAASKAALNMVGIQLAKDLSKDQIGVVMQTPGWVKTDMGGEDAKYTPTESISRVLKVWRSVGLEDTGSFLDENGEKVPW